MLNIENYFESQYQELPIISQSKDGKFIWKVLCLGCNNENTMIISSSQNYHKQGEIIEDPACKECRKEKTQVTKYKLLQLKN